MSLIEETVTYYKSNMCFINTNFLTEVQMSVNRWATKVYDRLLQLCYANNYIHILK